MLGGLGVGEHGKWPVSHGNLARIEACRIRLAGAYGTLGMFQASWLVGWLEAYLNGLGLGWVGITLHSSTGVSCGFGNLGIL
jgi:hypothetical protein